MTPPKRVVIAHADPHARDHVRRAAESRLGSVATVQADSFEALLEQLGEEPGTDLVIVDLDLPGMFWEVGLRHLAASKSGMRIAVLCSGGPRGKVDSMAANIAALVPIELPRDLLADALERVLAADSAVISSPGTPEFVSVDNPTRTKALDHALTGRQCDVLRLLSQGLSNLQIAGRLGIAEGTVKVHINAAFHILGVHNRVSAAVAFKEYFEERSAPVGA